MAEANSRGDKSPSGPGTSSRPGPGSYQGDTTGMHAIDPFGFQHRDANPLQQFEHQNALRDYLTRDQPEPPTSKPSRGGETTTWTQSPSADGSGWTVCRPQAAWC